MMKIYTKNGDKGTTSLIGGEIIPKSHIRLEVYGTIDELNSYLGLVNAYNINERSTSFLQEIQNTLFELGTVFSSSSEQITTGNNFKIENVTRIENQIDKLNIELPILKNFILPGGNTAVATCHIARTVCRRLERRIITLSEEIKINKIILQYVNRLSDYLFVLARKLLNDVKIQEIIYIKNK